MRPWDYLFVDQPAGCITLGNSVTSTSRSTSAATSALQNNSQISSPAVAPPREPLVKNSAQIGPPGARSESSPAPARAPTAAPSRRAVHRVMCTRTRSGRARRSSRSRLSDLSYWYTNAQLGPQSACTTGSFPGGFDNDTTLNVSRGEIDLTPARRTTAGRSSARPERVAQIAWAAGLAGNADDQGRHLLRRASDLVEPQPDPVRREGRDLRLGAGPDQEPRRHLRRSGVRRDVGSAGRSPRLRRRLARLAGRRPTRSAATSATT